MPSRNPEEYKIPGVPSSGLKDQPSKLGKPKKAKIGKIKRRPIGEAQTTLELKRRLEERNRKLARKK